MFISWTNEIKSRNLYLVGTIMWQKNQSSLSQVCKQRAVAQSMPTVKIAYMKFLEYLFGFYITLLFYSMYI